VYPAARPLNPEAVNFEVGLHLQPAFGSSYSAYIFTRSLAIPPSGWSATSESTVESSHQQRNHNCLEESERVDRNYQDLKSNSDPDSYDSSELATKGVPVSERLHMPDSTSRTWASFEQMEAEKWRYLNRRLECMFPAERPFGKSSPFVPRSFEDYVRHRKEMQDAEVELARRQLAQAQHERKYEGFSKKIDQAFGGKKFGSVTASFDGKGQNASANPPNRGSVLAQPTMWCGPTSSPSRTPAPWPCMQEMQWEGDQRVATENGRYGRFLPIPRDAPGPKDSTPWHAREKSEFEEIDQVWRVPTVEDICAPVEEIDDPEIISQLLNKGILDAIDDLV
jgi:hypothetical protein